MTQHLPSDFHCPLSACREAHLRRLSRILTALALLVLTACPARAAWMVPGWPDRPKDFAFVKHDGLYHLFYIRHNMDRSNDSTEVDLGHAVSADLWNWTQEPTVLPIRSGKWDRSHVWAPSIVEKDGVFTLFYTGVSTVPGQSSGWQRTGVATSTDLFEWTRLDAPVFACTAVPWTVCDSTKSTTAFRDPFVMPDPAHPGHWLMYYSTFSSADSAGMVVGMASSDGDLRTWSDLGPLWITNRRYCYSDYAESPHLFDHDGLWYLFFTTNAGQPISFATGTNPVGPPSSWTSRGRLANMLGVDTSPWFASEHLRDGLVDYFAYVLGDRIDVKRIVWGTPGNFALAQPALMHVRSMAWGRDSTMQDSTETLTIIAAGWAAAPAQIEARRLLADGSLVPVSLDSLGLSVSVTLTGDTTRVSWPAAWLPDPEDTTRALRIVVRLTDQTAGADTLTIARRPPLVITGMGWERAEAADGDTVRLGVAAQDWLGRSVGLSTLRLRSDDTEVELSPETLGLPAVLPFSGDTTWVSWPARWLPDEPDTARLLRLRVRTGNGSAAAEPITVIGPGPLQVDTLLWAAGSVAEGDTAWLGIVAENWLRRGADLTLERILSDGSRVLLSPDTLGFPAHVTFTADTTWVPWPATWLPDDPDTTRMLKLVVRLADSSRVAEPLVVVGPERPLRVFALTWDREVVAEGDTAHLGIVTQNWLARSVDLETLRLRSDSTRVPVSSEALGLTTNVALVGDTTWVAWRSTWLPEEPDTARLLNLVVRTADSSVVAPALTVIGPEALRVDTLVWAAGEVAEGDTAHLGIVAANWRLRGVDLGVARLRSDSSVVEMRPDTLGLPAHVALVGDTTWVAWRSTWLPDEPDTARLLKLVVRTQGKSAEPLVVVGPEALRVDTLVWAAGEVAEGDTAHLGIVAANWRLRGVDLGVARLRSDSSVVEMRPDTLGLPGHVALVGDTTWVSWRSTWLPEDPDTARLLNLVVRTQGKSAEPLAVVGPEPALVDTLVWSPNPVADGETARLGIVAQRWARRSLRLESARLLSNGTEVPLPAELPVLPTTVALSGDTTWVSWPATWLPEEPDTARLLKLVVRLADSSRVAEPLVVVGPERPLRIFALTWDREVVAEGDTAHLGIVTQNWAERSVNLETLRLRSDSTRVPVSSEALGLTTRVTLVGDTTWVAWRSTWLPEDPDTARLLNLVVRTADSSVVAAPITVIGPEALRVDTLVWAAGEVAEGDTAHLGIVAANWRLRGVDLGVARLRSDSSVVEMRPDTLGLPAHVALVGDTTWVSWRSTWLPDEPDTTRLLRLIVRLADSSRVAEPLTVMGPERPLYVRALAWDRAEVAEGDTAQLGIVAQNWLTRSVDLEALRLRSDGTRVPLSGDELGLATTVALVGDTTWVSWRSTWLPEEPDTARLLNLVVRTADSSVVAAPITVIGPEALRVDTLLWAVGEVAEGDTAWLGIVAANWRLRGVDLAATRLLASGTEVPLPAEVPALPSHVTLTGDTTWVAWRSTWLPEDPDTARLLRLAVRTTEGKSAEPLVVVGPEPVVLDTLVWSPNPVAEGDTARLGIVAQRWARRSLRLESARLLSNGTQVPPSADLPALPTTVALVGDTTWVSWPATWLPDEPDTARLLNLLVRTQGKSAEPLVVVGPEPVLVDTLVWSPNPVADGETARLGIVTQHWARRSLRLESARLLSNGTEVSLPAELPVLPTTVALVGDTTWVSWPATWLAEEPDTARLLKLVVRLADSSRVAEPLVVVGPERPLRVFALTWDREVVAEGDTAHLGIVTQNWAERSVDLETLRLRSDSTRVPVSSEALGLTKNVALVGDTTWVAWRSTWLPEEPDTARLLNLVVRTADSSVVAAPITVIGPEALRVDTLVWAAGEVAEGDTAHLGIVAANWRLRGVDLGVARLRSDSSVVEMRPDTLGLPAHVALVGDTTWVSWRSTWLPDEPDTTRLLRLIVRLADSSRVAEPLTVMGPERPLYVRALAWDRAEVAEGDTAHLGIVAQNWLARSVDLEALRLRSDGTRVLMSGDELGLATTVALVGDTTWVSWRSTWLPDEPDTARLLNLVVRTADSSVVAAPITVVGPERPLRVLAMAWDQAKVNRDETVTLAIVAQNWAGHSVELRGLRRRADRSLVPIALDTLGLPTTVALTADTTRLEWTAVWLPDPPDTVRPLDLFLALADSSRVTGCLSVVGPPWPPDSLAAVPDPDVPATLRLESVYPTPTRGALWVSFTLADGVPASLEMVDIAGRRMWRQSVGPAAGRHTVRLDRGTLPDGVYFVCLRQGGRQLVARAVIVR